MGSGCAVGFMWRSLPGRGELASARGLEQLLLTGRIASLVGLRISVRILYGFGRAVGFVGVRSPVGANSVRPPALRPTAPSAGAQKSACTDAAFRHSGHPTPRVPRFENGVPRGNMVGEGAPSIRAAFFVS